MTRLARLLPFVLAAGIAAGASAQGAPAAAPSGKAARADVAMDALKGAWVRTDGGYVILIRNVAADGQIDATYFNPATLPFARAKAVRTDKTIRLAFELRAGNYAGSTYDLTYDAATDRLVGRFNQAVARQTFDVQFVRRKA